MSDAAMVASYARAIARRGVPFTLQRLTGYAPNVTIASFAVNAAIISDEARRFSGSGDGESISTDFRSIVLLERDLVAVGFPLPIQKNDRVVLQAATYSLDTTNVDQDTRAVAGVIVLSLSGVS